MARHLYPFPQTRTRQPPESAAKLDIRRGLAEVWDGSSFARTKLKGTPADGLGNVVRKGGPAGLAAYVQVAADTTNGVNIGNPESLFAGSSTECTIAIFRRCTDTTARESALFGYNESNMIRVLAHAPYSDGKIYWDFGTSAGTGRISTAYAKDTEPETLVFTAGASVGREIWRRGVRIAADAAATAARTATALTTFAVGGVSGTAPNGPVAAGADDVEIYLIAISNRVWSPGEIFSFARNPWQLFAPEARWLRVGSANVQLLRPVSDISAGAWTPSSGGALYAMLDEATPDDADFITVSSASTCEVMLSTGTDPLSSVGHLPRIRAKGTGTLTIHLVQGTTIIKTMSPTLTGSYQTFAFTLSGAEADAITNYGDLRYRYVSS